MTRAALRRPLSFVGHRLMTLFRDPPTWAEFISALGVMAYGLSFIGNGKSPEDWHSLTLVTSLLPEWWWAAITICGALVQFAGLFLGNRFLRASAAFGMLIWVVFMARLVWPVYPWSPLLMLALATIGPANFLVVARHSRDW